MGLGFGPDGNLYVSANVFLNESGAIQWQYWRVHGCFHFGLGGRRDVPLQRLRHHGD